MTRVLALAPWLGLIAYQALGVACGFRPEVMRALTLACFWPWRPLLGSGVSEGKLELL